MNLKAVDWIFALSVIAAGGLTGVAQALGTALPSHQAQIMNITAIIVAVAGLLVRMFGNKTGAPATSIVADAQVVPAGTPVVHADTPTVGTAVSTTSTLPIVAPQKGTP